MSLSIDPRRTYLRRVWMLPVVILLLHYSATGQQLQSGEILGEDAPPGAPLPSTLSLSPIILVPGAGGSRLNAAAVNKPKLANRFCDRNDKFIQLWPTPNIALPLAVDCWVDNIRLVWDNATGHTINSPGVNITVPGFGKTDMIEYLTDAKVGASRYFKFMVDSAASWGYQRGINIKGAPYDFRKSPHEAKEYLRNLKQLIEETYDANNGHKVSLVAHSLGNLYTLYLLHHQTQDWKDKYIRAYFAIGAPFSGSISAIKALASGYDLGKAILPALKLRTAERTWPSMALMLPRKPGFSPDEVLVRTRNRVYTLNDYDDFYRDVDYPDGVDIHHRVKKILNPTKGPGVEVHCIVGTGRTTPASVTYTKKSFPNSQPQEIMEDGDGTVLTRSASLCQMWNTTQTQPITYKEFFGVEHLALVFSLDVITYIKSVLDPEPAA